MRISDWSSDVCSSDLGIGDTVQIRPDTDVYLLAALLHEIDRLGGLDEGVLARHGANVDGLREFVARYDADRVAPVTGVPAETTRELAARSEESRVGKGCVSTCRYRGLPRHQKTKHETLLMLHYKTCSKP